MGGCNKIGYSVALSALRRSSWKMAKENSESVRYPDASGSSVTPVMSKRIHLSLLLPFRRCFLRSFCSLVLYYLLAPTAPNQHQYLCTPIVGLRLFVLSTWEESPLLWHSWPDLPLRTNAPRNCRNPNYHCPHYCCVCFPVGWLSIPPSCR